jgi:4a-hydroxytetrahydrobiopterin dehydratase
MWQEKDEQLYREFKFKDFKQAFDFMAKVAKEADALNHHPKWTNVYNRVEIWLSTHSAGDVVTDKDRQLAGKIDRIFDENAEI